MPARLPALGDDITRKGVSNSREFDTNIGKFATKCGKFDTNSGMFDTKCGTFVTNSGKFDTKRAEFVTNSGEFVTPVRGGTSAVRRSVTCETV